VQNIPENIEPVLEFFGLNKHQQYIKYKIGRLQDDKTDLLKSIEIEPKLSSAYWNIHFLFLLEGRINEALNTLEQCTECAIMSNSLHNFTTICSTTDNNKNNCSDLKNINMKFYQFYQNLLHSKAFIYSLLNDTKMKLKCGLNRSIVIQHSSWLMIKGLIFIK
ncbi:o-linked n-acetylglucosamine-like protein, partial [Schistosoma japonicum]